MIKTVHVVFKTHLDIGFTDFAARTIERYHKQFIPQAIEVAKQLRRRGGKERLVWTTGSWLVKDYFEASGPEEKALFVEAVEAGDITWHALPFTTHTELMSGPLVEYALSLSQNLDARFGHTTIAAKMTDVPGHTLALVPFLAKAGVQFLHIGVNGGSPLPDVPPLFVWRAPTGEEVLVQYDASYGSSEPIGELEDVLVIENSADNAGPPKAEEVYAVFEKLEKKYPGSVIMASDLSSYARAILPFKHTLPVVKGEIGDTWIHGIGSDPYKVSCLKRLLAWAQTNVEVLGNDRFMDRLLMICEHTWGLDFKKYLGDYTNYAIEDFHRARELDIVAASAVPPAYRFIEAFAQKEYAHIFGEQDQRRKTRRYSLFSASHQEQRSYVEQAIASLPPLLRQQALDSLKPRNTPIDCKEKPAYRLSSNTPIQIGSVQVVIADDGSISSLLTSEGRQMAKGEGIGVYRYESFSAADYDRFHHQYNRNFESGRDWILADYGKPGMEALQPAPEHRLCKARLTDLVRCDAKDIVQIRASLEAVEESPRGAPKHIHILYCFSKAGTLVEITLAWNDKEATRLPEALWLSIGLNTEEGGTWRMRKLGQSLPLDTTVSKGARSIHAVEGLAYEHATKPLLIENLDSPLISLGQRKLLCFDDELPRNDGVFHFNLYNNIWNTNFPLWYEEDGRSTLRIT